MNIRQLLVISAALAAAGCISVKTENEIKPIHITMDVNLKVDREIDKMNADESKGNSSGRFKEVKDLLDRKVAGVTNLSLLEARAGATDGDRIAIAESNARKLKHLKQIATDSGVALESVQKRSAQKFRDRIPAGSGVWIQSDDGTWSQK